VCVSDINNKLLRLFRVKWHHWIFIFGEEYCLLGYNAIQSCECSRLFRSNMLLPFSGKNSGTKYLGIFFFESFRICGSSIEERPTEDRDVRRRILTHMSENVTDMERLTDTLTPKQHLTDTRDRQFLSRPHFTETLSQNCRLTDTLCPHSSKLIPVTCD
jgi:hypothetical protein